MTRPGRPRWVHRAARVLTACEAATVLTWSSLGVSLLRQRRLMRLLGASDGGSAEVGAAPAALTDRGEIVRARQVGRLVERVARRLPWRPACLAQAIAVRTMLRRRGIDATLHLGLISLDPLSAHAWVSVDERVIQGGLVRDVISVARFR